MDQQPKIPTLKDAQKPQVKIKGLGAGLTLFDRLKQFKKKDLAFILAGLGTLFMAPLAEHFMMAPEGGDASLQKGWGGGSGGSGSNLFGSGSSPYENGNNSIAQGGAIGGAGDIITPLNVRDPSALVMGPGAAQQPPAGSAAPAAPPPTTASSGSSHSESDYKDALAGAASRAASAAVKKSPLPVPKVALGGSGLRGLGVAGGGSSAASGGLGPINSGNLGQASAGGGGLNLVRANPNFRGAAGPRGPNNPSGLDGTKKAGANAGDFMNRAGNALGGLNGAASEQIPTGGNSSGGGGQGGAGANGDKAASGNGPGGNKSVGESLAFIEARERLMEGLKLEFEKKKLADTDLLLLGIRNDSLKAMASELTKGLTKGVMSFFDAKPGADSGSYECQGGYNFPLTKGACDEKVKTDCIDSRGPVYYDFDGKSHSCVKKAGKGDDAAKKTEGAPSSPGGAIAGGWPTGDEKAAADKLDADCDKIKDDIEKLQAGEYKTNAKAIETVKALQQLTPIMGKIISGRDELYGTKTSDKCGAKDYRKDKSVYELQAQIVSSMIGDGKDGVVPQLLDLSTKKEGNTQDQEGVIKTQRTAWTDANKKLEEAKGLLTGTADAVKAVPGLAGTIYEKDQVANAIKASEGLTGKVGVAGGYIPNETEMLKRIDPLLKGAEYAAMFDPTTVPKVIRVNKDYDDLSTAAKDAKVQADAPTSGESTVSAKDPKGAAEEVKTAVEDARTKIGTANDAVKKVAAEPDEQKKEPLRAQAKPLVSQAATAWSTGQQKQLAVLNDVVKGFNDIKAGVKSSDGTSTTNPTGNGDK